MKTTKIEPQEAVKGDKVFIIMRDGADRSGVVTGNDKETKELELVGDNLVILTISYNRIESIERNDK